MKHPKNVLPFLAAVALGTVLFTSLPAGAASPAQGDLVASGPGFLSLETRGAVRSVLRTGMRHLLNFRHETPLSDSQKREIRAIVETHREEIHAQMEKSRGAAREMASIVKTGEAGDGRKLEAAAEKVGDAAKSRALLTAKILRQVHPLLTSEQRTQLESARAEMQPLVDKILASVAR